MKGRVYEGLDDFILIITNNFHAFCINQKHYNFLQKVSNSRTFQTWICFDYVNGPSRAKSRALKIQQGLNETATLSLSCVQTLKSYGVIAFFHHCATLVTRTTGYNRTWKKQPPMCAQAHTVYVLQLPLLLKHVDDGESTSHSFFQQWLKFFRRGVAFIRNCKIFSNRHRLLSIMFSKRFCHSRLDFRWVIDNRYHLDDNVDPKVVDRRRHGG